MSFDGLNDAQKQLHDRLERSAGWSGAEFLR